VVCIDELPAVSEDGIDRLGKLVGDHPAVRSREGDRSAAGVQSHAHIGRCLDYGVYQRLCWTRMRYESLETRESTAVHGTFRGMRGAELPAQVDAAPELRAR
jgi:hypothetical protein